MAKIIEQAKIDLELAKLNQPKNVVLYNKLFYKLNVLLKETKEAEVEYQEIFTKSYTLRKEYLEQYNDTISKLNSSEEEIIQFIKTALKNYVIYQSTRIRAQIDEVDMKFKVMILIFNKNYIFKEI